MLAKIRVCLACGHPLPEKHDFKLSHSQDIIYAAAKRSGTRGVSRQHLEHLLYDEDEPPRERSTVPTLVCQLNRRLKPYGLRITGSRGRDPDNRYRLHYVALS